MFELADAAFHVALLVFRGVVVAVFAEVAHQSCRLNFLGDFDAAARAEVVVLCLQTVVRGPGELGTSHRAVKPTCAAGALDMRLASGRQPVETGG